jgi:hypothetical protein
MENDDMPDVPPPMLQLGFHPLTGWTVIAAKHEVVQGNDIPTHVRDAFHEQFGHDMPEDEAVVVGVTVKGRVFESIDELAEWMAKLPELWPWFTNQVRDVPEHLGLQEAAS